MDYKLSKAEAWSLISSIAGVVFVVIFLFWYFTILDNAERQVTEARARCKSLGGEWGYSKCFKNGKEI